MKILYSHHAFSMQRHGGVSRYFAELLKRIPSCGDASTRVVAPLFDNEYLAEVGRQAEGRDSILGLKVPHVPGLRYPRRRVSALLSKWITGRLGGVDIFHQTYFSLNDYAPSSARRVLTVFDMIHELFPGDFRAQDKTREAKRASVARADHVICISQSTRSDLIRLLGVSPSKLSVVYLGGDLGVGVSLAPVRNRPVRPFVLYVGQRQGYKNFLTLLSEFADSPLLRSRFDLLCFGGGEFSAVERAAIAASGADFGHVVHRSGNDRMLAALYAQASAFVYPSLYEGFGIPPLEAMAAGCPVICAGTSSLPEVVGDAAEQFDPGVPGSIALALQRVLDDPTRSAELVLRGIERATAFSWERCARETFEVYRDVLAQ